MGIFRPTMDATIVIRVTEAERAAWHRAARRARQPLSVWLRAAAERAIAQQARRK